MLSLSLTNQTQKLNLNDYFRFSLDFSVLLKTYPTFADSCLLTKLRTNSYLHSKEIE